MTLLYIILYFIGTIAAVIFIRIFEVYNNMEKPTIEIISILTIFSWGTVVVFGLILLTHKLFKYIYIPIYNYISKIIDKNESDRTSD